MLSLHYCMQRTGFCFSLVPLMCLKSRKLHMALNKLLGLRMGCFRHFLLLKVPKTVWLIHLYSPTRKGWIFFLSRCMRIIFCYWYYEYASVMKDWGPLDYFWVLRWFKTVILCFCLELNVLKGYWSRMPLQTLGLPLLSIHYYWRMILYLATHSYKGV